MARKLSSLSISECWNFLAAGGIIILRGEDGMFFLSWTSFFNLKIHGLFLTNKAKPYCHVFFLKSPKDRPVLLRKSCIYIYKHIYGTTSILVLTLFLLTFDQDMDTLVGNICEALQVLIYQWNVYRGKWCPNVCITNMHVIDNIL